MAFLEIDSTLNIGLLLTLTGIIIFYFGRVIIKSRKETTGDVTSESLWGILFIADVLIIPAVALYSIFIIITQLLLPLINSEEIVCQTVLLYGMSFLFIVIKYEIFSRYEKIVKTPGAKTNKWKNMAVGGILILFTFILYFYKQWPFLVGSIIMDFLILTFMASRDHFRDENNNKDDKWLEIKLNSRKKPLKLKIKRLGTEFIDFIDEKKKEVSINKSDIISIKKD